MPSSEWDEVEPTLLKKTCVQSPHHSYRFYVPPCEANNVWTISFSASPQLFQFYVPALEDIQCDADHQRLGGNPWDRQGHRARQEKLGRSIELGQKHETTILSKRNVCEAMYLTLSIYSGSQRLLNEWSLGHSKRNFLYFSWQTYSHYTLRSRNYVARMMQTMWQLVRRPSIGKDVRTASKDWWAKKEE